MKENKCENYLVLRKLLRILWNYWQLIMVTAKFLVNSVVRLLTVGGVI